VDISLIDVEVIATRDGEPVTDLTREDFEILDDGQPVEITHFSRVESGRRLYPGQTAIQEETVSTGTPASTRESSTVIVVVDQLFISPVSRRQVFDAVRRHLEPLLADGAQIMVVSKIRDITIEQDLTTNGALVDAAFERLAGAAPPGYATEIRSIAELWEIEPEFAESRQTGPGQPEPALATSVIDAQAAYQDANAISRRIHADVRASLAQLHRFLDSLAGMPGRKALLYVADELPLQPAAQLWRIWWEKFGVDHGARLGVTSSGPSELDATLELEALISDANASRVSFYPVGTSGGADFLSASARGLSAQNLSAASRRSTSASDGLVWLADRTGGRAAVRGGSYDRLLSDMTTDLGTFYSIGYQSPHAADGEVHRIEIRVDRDGVRLRHPTEYRDKSADQRLRDRTLAGLTVGVRENPLDARVEVGKARRRKGGLWAAELEIHVPMANLVLLPGSTTHRGKLSIQLISRNGRGDFSDPVMIRMPLEVAHRDMSWALSQTVDYATEIMLGEGRNTIAIGVYDDLGQVGSTLGVEIDVGG
jgi:VWFA-related protein